MMSTISVVIPMYNAQPFLADTIRSILSQTVTHFELLIVDDGSTDSSLDIARSFADPRIRILDGQINRGQSCAQNRGLREARGEYIAILGADDIALPNRLATQAAFLDSHSDVSLVGTSYFTLNSDGICTQIDVPAEPVAVRWRLLFGNPIAAPAVMLRRSILAEIGSFDESIRFGEDWELWGRIAAHGKIAQIAEPLTKYRVHPQSITRRMRDSVKPWQREICRRNIALLAGISVSDQVVESLASLRSDPQRIATVQAFDIIWKCALHYYSFIIRTPREGRLVFGEILRDLLRLARQNESCRLHALEIALRCGLRCTPESLLTPQFIKFSARVALPAGARRWFR